MSFLNLERLDPAIQLEALDELRDWTDWLRRTYGGAQRSLPACWMNHPDLVLDLLALAERWREIYEPADEKKQLGPEAALQWRGHLNTLWLSWAEVRCGQTCGRKEPHEVKPEELSPLDAQSSAHSGHGGGSARSGSGADGLSVANGASG